MDKTFRILILNNSAEKILISLAELGLIYIQEEYESLYIENYVELKSKAGVIPKLKFIFSDFNKQETRLGRKLVILELSQEIGSIEVPKTANCPRAKIVENVSKLFIHEEDFVSSKGFQIDDKTSTAILETQDLFLDISNDGSVWLLSKPISEYLKNEKRQNSPRNTRLTELVEKLGKK